MTIEILSTGEEVRSGDIVDTNAAFIAQALEDTGLPAARHLCVGDDRSALVSVFKEISRRSDVAIVTGGLGPTADDLTAEAAAEAAGKKRILNEAALASIRAYFQAKKRKMAASDQKQALLPDGARMLDNPIGTAPGFEVKIGRCTFFCLPGVPREMKRMLEQIVLPRAMVLLGNQRIAQQSAAYSVYGLTEAVVGERLDKLAANYPAVRIGLRAAFPVIHVKLNVQETDGPSAAELLAQADQWIRKTLGRKLFATGNASMAEVVGRLLTRKASTLALAESCTGGLIANWVTDVAGSSDYFLFSGVTYANSSKIGVLKVSPNLISQVGAVHEDTAQAMAQGARLIAGATYGLATSGIAGPSGGTPDKPVGTVCIGLATPHKTAGYRYTFPYRNRLKNKEVFAMQALDLLRRELLQTKLE